MKIYILIFIVAFLNGVCTTLMQEEIRERQNMIRGGKLICFTLFILFGSLVLLIGFGRVWVLAFSGWINEQTSIRFFLQFFLTKEYSNLSERDLLTFKIMYNHFLRKKNETNAKLDFSEKNLYKGLELIRKRYNKPNDWYILKENNYE